MHTPKQSAHLPIPLSQNIYQYRPARLKLPSNLYLCVRLNYIQRVKHHPETRSQNPSTYKIINQMPCLCLGFGEQLLNRSTQTEEKNIARAISKQDWNKATVKLSDAV
ncbi:hypothetical protein M9458_002026, partial [Cirrhinus mrigala]